LKKIILIILLIIITISLIVLISQKNGYSFQKTYKGEGNWPKMAGHWESRSGLVGDKIARWSYFNIIIKENGLFEGTYCGYRQTGNTQVQYANCPVFGPDNSYSKKVWGAVNFTKKKAIMTLEGLDEVNCGIENVDDNQGIAFTFPDTFKYVGTSIRQNSN
jgi:hypothetical protein